MPHMTTDYLFYAFLSPDNGATEVFRAATECGCGPTKGSESPLATEGKTEGGAKTIVSMTEQFYAEWNEAILKMGCGLS